MKKSRFLLMSATLGETRFFEKSLTELTGKETVLVRSTDRPVPLDFEYSERALHFKIADLISAGKAPIYLVNFTQRESAEEAQNLLSVDFCSKEEKKRIADELEGVDFGSPYGKEFQRLLRHGVGLHHAGLLPRYRVLVEKLAQKGLLKVISGTDTLGVGVNVPIRTVLFTKLCKYDGQKTTILSVRDFQQIAGRAGRRGFDESGSVVVQAPQHVIENLALEAKAAKDPKKAKKLVKRKPPERGFLPWNKDTMEKLIQGRPEELVSRFQVTHGMILNVLSRPGTRDCRPLRRLIRDSHESEHMKKQHRKLASRLFRSLIERKIIELDPIRVNIDLQQDFSLNQTLSLYLLDAIEVLDQNDPNYALDLLSLVEAILENPDLILRRQVDRLKTLKMEELKAAGVEYEKRIEELESVEHPKPNREFIYETFNRFSQAHPWIGQENIRPKSVAREMFETFQTFHDYIREYDLHRVEGLLLRYLSETYKVLAQSVPERARSAEVEAMIEYFREILHGVDSSLIDEWEKMRDPEGAAAKAALRAERESEWERERLEQEALRKAERTREISVRNEVFRIVRLLWKLDYTAAGEALDCSPLEIEKAMTEYQVGHSGILLDQNARSNQFVHLVKVDGEECTWEIEQILVDPDGHNDWALKVRATLEPSEVGSVSTRPKISFLSLAPLN